jgi:hypothetical protein
MLKKRIKHSPGVGKSIKQRIIKRFVMFLNSEWWRWQIKLRIEKQISIINIIK